MFKPNVQQFATVIRIQKRNSVPVNGDPLVSYVDAEPPIDFCDWKGKGGTESVNAGKLIVEDTAEVVMWYRPDVTERDRLLLDNNPKSAYDVVNAEDVEKRHQYLILKVRRAVNA
jgi:head-tail adaptor